MAITTTKRHQTLYDIAIEQYGTAEAIGELLSLNPGITNDPAELAARGIDVQQDSGLYLDVAVEPDITIVINEQSTLRRPNTIKQITNEITTYEYGEDN